MAQAAQQNADNMVDVDYMRVNYGKPEDQVYEEDNPGKFKDENMYRYHENTQTFDPAVQPYSFFYLTVTGQI